MKELYIIQTELHAPKDKMNAFAGFAFRNAEGILRAVKPLLKANKCSLLMSDDVELIGDRFYVKSTATLINESGERETVSAYAREQLAKKGNDDAQVTGSCSSYARKTALCGLLAIDDSSVDPDMQDNTEEAPQATKETLTLETAIAEAKAAKTAAQMKKVCDKYRAVFGKTPEFVKVVTEASAAFKK